MSHKEKQLLLQDLCARLPYKVKIMFSSNGFRWDWEQTLEEITKCDDGKYAINGWGIHGIKPYLRPMSSMTEEEKVEYCDLQDKFLLSSQYPVTDGYALFDWLNERHFDYRGLIPKGLAISTEEFNPYK